MSGGILKYVLHFNAQVSSNVYSLFHAFAHGSTLSIIRELGFGNMMSMNN